MKTMHCPTCYPRTQDGTPADCVVCKNTRRVESVPNTYVHVKMNRGPILSLRLDVPAGFAELFRGEES